MIVHKVNDPPSAQRFHQRAKNYVIFVKFYSPTCPACIASEEEWGKLKDNIAPENRDHFDLAEVDPEGMRELQDHKYDNMNIDVQFVPTFAVMKDGKVADIYEGERNHRDMIQFLKDKKYLKEYNKMSEDERCMQRGGGSRRRSGKRKSKKRRVTRKKKGKRRRRSVKQRGGDYETEQEKHLRAHKEFHKIKREKNKNAAEEMKKIGEYTHPEREGPYSDLVHPYEYRVIGPAEREERLRTGDTNFYDVAALNQNFKDQMEDATGEGIEEGIIIEDPEDPQYPYGPITFGGSKKRKRKRTTKKKRRT
jgi:thiol-disulfide isomerase/thioredoxin